MRFNRLRWIALAKVALSVQSQAQMSGGMDPMPSLPEQADPTIAYNDGIAALGVGDYSKALRELLKARNARSDDPEINYALGLAYKGVGKKADAKRTFQRAVHGRDAPTGAFLQLGLIALDLGDRATAVAQQAALDAKLAACGTKCTDGVRTEILAASYKLSAAISTH